MQHCAIFLYCILHIWWYVAFWNIYSIFNHFSSMYTENQDSVYNFGGGDGSLIIMFLIAWFTWSINPNERSCIVGILILRGRLLIIWGWGGALWRFSPDQFFSAIVWFQFLEEPPVSIFPWRPSESIFFAVFNTPTPPRWLMVDPQETLSNKWQRIDNE